MPFTKTPFFGYFSSANASALDEANSRFTLYTRDPVTKVATPVVLGSDDFVEISDIAWVFASALIGTIYDGADATVDAGEVLGVARSTTGMLSFQHRYATPIACRKGTYPKFKCSATGAVECQISGLLVKKQG